MTEDRIAMIIKELESDGMFTRQYEGEEYRRELAVAAYTIWNHMIQLDHGNLKRWMGCARLANAYARSCSRGTRMFDLSSTKWTTTEE